MRASPYRRISIVVVAAAAIATLGASSSAMAAPSHTAGAPECEQVVASYGYVVGPGVQGACGVLEPPPPTYGERLDCQGRLEGLGVANNIAIEACWK